MSNASAASASNAFSIVGTITDTEPAGAVDEIAERVRDDEAVLDDEDACVSLRPGGQWWGIDLELAVQSLNREQERDLGPPLRTAIASSINRMPNPRRVAH